MKTDIFCIAEMIVFTVLQDITVECALYNLWREGAEQREKKPVHPHVPSGIFRLSPARRIYILQNPIG